MTFYETLKNANGRIFLRMFLNFMELSTIGGVRSVGRLFF